MEKFRICKKCKIKKSIDDFYWRSATSTASTKGGKRKYRYWECKLCRREIAEQWAKDHPERARVMALKAVIKFRETHPEWYRKQVLKHSKRFKEKYRTDSEFRELILERNRRKYRENAVYRKKQQLRNKANYEKIKKQ